jgi:EF hand
MTMRTLLIGLAGALTISGAALAQDITTGHLDAMDGNDDGVVEATEFDAFMAQAFAAIDTNGDGYITEAEGTGFMSPEQYAAGNTNGDDGLSQDEFMAVAKSDFTGADLDGNGALN